VGVACALAAADAAACCGRRNVKDARDQGVRPHDISACSTRDLGRALMRGPRRARLQEFGRPALGCQRPAGDARNIITTHRALELFRRTDESSVFASENAGHLRCH